MDRASDDCSDNVPRPPFFAWLNRSGRRKTTLLFHRTGLYLLAMACRVFSDPAVFDGATIIACGPELRRKCKFCDCRHANALCDWPVIKPVHFEPYDAIGEGDILAQPGGWRARIQELQPRAGCLDVRAVVLDLGKRAGIPRRVKPPFRTAFPISPHNFQKFRVMRPGTCDNPCCARHRRHVGPDRDYCMDHWRAWEQVA